MSPVQIIHHKADGTKEYFYEEHSPKAKKGAKSFCFDPNYSEKGHFVTFSIDSFSDIEILAVAKSETGYEISYTDGALKITADKDGVYTLILTSYSGNQMIDAKVLNPELNKDDNKITETQLEGFSLTDGSKIFLWESLLTQKPLCEAYIVNAE